MRTLTLLFLGSLAFAGETAQDSSTVTIAPFEKDRRWVVVEAKVKVAAPFQAADEKGNAVGAQGEGNTVRLVVPFIPANEKARVVVKSGAGATVDHSANGFHPSKVLRDFDYGQVSTTPDGRTVRQWDVFAADREVEVAPGVRFPAWTFNSRIPGPTLRCRDGDLLRVRFVNGSAHPHTMHFHGIHPADMDGVPMVGRGVILPGESFTYTFDAEPFGLHLVQRFGFRQPRQAVITEAAIPHARRRGAVDRVRGHDDLPAVRDRADARDGVYRDPDVAGVGERGPAAVDAGTHEHLDAARPGPPAQLGEQIDRRLHRGVRTFEHREELVAVAIDRVPARAGNRLLRARAHVAQQARVVVAHPDQVACAVGAREIEIESHLLGDVVGVGSEDVEHETTAG